MPELVEVEAYRRLAETSALGRTIAEVVAPDPWYLKGGLTAGAAQDALRGRSLTAADRLGKLLLLATGEGGPVVGIRFGMTGRLVVDGTPGVESLRYSSNRAEARWDRFSLRFADGGTLAVRDPRRLGGVDLDPSEGRLGPDALTIGLAGLRVALDRSIVPLKARLLDQAHLAGVGNLIADETLWRAGLSPERPAGGLTAAELRRLHRHLRGTLADLMARGGSHTGDLMAERRPGGHCPKDGTPLVRSTVGTRTTWWCPAHQR
ncbi:MAG TPA: DNA-formamidopyrimidine glycosylase family protein [Acidimicrobiales bacterium]|nr:DNA-formamidopyrimidine glycosylase family protein [Acidimicrobiales bacterium]